MFITRWSTLGLAQAFADRCIKAHAVMLGDDGYFWVVSLGDAERLARQGYQWA